MKKICACPGGGSTIHCCMLLYGLNSFSRGSTSGEGVELQLHNWTFATGKVRTLDFDGYQEIVVTCTFFFCLFFSSVRSLVG